MMQALDKLSEKANIIKEEKGKKEGEYENDELDTINNQKEASSNDNKKKLTSKKKRIVKKNQGKHPGGRKNTRGEAGKDFKMLNVAVRTDLYEKLKEASNGNMTFFINNLLEKTIK